MINLNINNTKPLIGNISTSNQELNRAIPQSILNNLITSINNLDNISTRQSLFFQNLTLEQSASIYRSSLETILYTLRNLYFGTNRTTNSLYYLRQETIPLHRLNDIRFATYLTQHYQATLNTQDLTIKQSFWFSPLEFVKNTFESLKTGTIDSIEKTSSNQQQLQNQLITQIHTPGNTPGNWATFKNNLAIYKQHRNFQQLDNPSYKYSETKRPKRQEHRSLLKTLAKGIKELADSLRLKLLGKNKGKHKNGHTKK